MVNGYGSPWLVMVGLWPKRGDDGNHGYTFATHLENLSSHKHKTIHKERIDALGIDPRFEVDHLFHSNRIIGRNHGDFNG